LLKNDLENVENVNKRIRLETAFGWRRKLVVRQLGKLK